MVKIQQILVATDFSETSQAAVKQAVELAQVFRAKLDVVHVLSEPFNYFGGMNGLVPEVEAYRQAVEEVARNKLHHVLSESEVQLVQARLFLRTGSAHAEIVKFVKDMGVDLVVMGTHGYGAMRHLMLGSVAEQVVRHASCPVLTIGHLSQPRHSS